MMDEHIDKAKIKVIEDYNLPDEAKQIGKLGVVLGINYDTIVHSIVDIISSIKTEDANNKYKLQQFPDDYTEIERAIAEMLTESTGVNILDSGFEDGRSWQINRKITDFRKSPELDVDIYSDEVVITLNIFHYLTSMLEINDETKKLNEEFNEFAKNIDGTWLECIGKFGDKLMDEDWNVSPTFNIYNDDNILSQGIQGMTFYKESSHEYDPFIIIQIHNGTDIRGGYTKPRIFKIIDLEEYLMAQEDVNVIIYSDDGGSHWYTDGVNLHIKNYKLPDEWKVYNINGENILKCEKCNSVVKFYASLQF